MLRTITVLVTLLTFGCATAPKTVVTLETPEEEETEDDPLVEEEEDGDRSDWSRTRTGTSDVAVTTGANIVMVGGVILVAVCVVGIVVFLAAVATGGVGATPGGG